MYPVQVLSVSILIIINSLLSKVVVPNVAVFACDVPLLSKSPINPPSPSTGTGGPKGSWYMYMYVYIRRPLLAKGAERVKPVSKSLINKLAKN